MAFSQEWVYLLDDNFVPKKARNGVETSDIKKKKITKLWEFYRASSNNKS